MLELNPLTSDLRGGLALSFVRRHDLLALRLPALAPLAPLRRFRLGLAALLVFFGVALGVIRVGVLSLLGESLGVPLNLGLDVAGAARLQLFVGFEFKLFEQAVRIARGARESVSHDMNVEQSCQRLSTRSRCQLSSSEQRATADTYDALDAFCGVRVVADGKLLELLEQNAPFLRHGDEGGQIARTGLADVGDHREKMPREVCSKHTNRMADELWSGEGVSGAAPPQRS